MSTLSVSLDPTARAPVRRWWQRAFDALLGWLFVADRTLDEHEPYPDIDAATVAADLDIEAVGARLGQLGQPAAGTAREASFERQLDAAMVRRIDEARRRAERRLRFLDASIRAVNLERDTARLEKLAERFERDADKVQGDGRRTLATLADTHRRVRDEHDAFRQAHRLERAARLPDSRTLAFAWLFLILVLETVLNGYFFAEGSDFGLVGGALQALLISLVNVLLAAVVAHWPLRWLRHRSIPLKIFSGLLVTIYAAALFAAAWFAALYREAFVIAPDNALAVAVENASGGGGVPLQFDSWLFFVLSIGFAAVALFEVFRMDDPYPGFGTITRRLARSEEEVREDRDELVGSLEACRSECVAELDELTEDLERLGDRLELDRAAHDNLAAGWAPYMRRLEVLHGALVARFREENRAHRTDPAPAWFDEPAMLATGPFDPDVPEAPEIRRAREGVRKLQGLAAKRRNALTARYNHIVAELDAMFDLTDAAGAPEIRS